jgi:hypothetical protein
VLFVNDSKHKNNDNDSSSIDDINSSNSRNKDRKPLFQPSLPPGKSLALILKDRRSIGISLSLYDECAPNGSRIECKEDAIKIQFRISNGAKLLVDELTKRSSLPEAAYLVMNKINTAGSSDKVKSTLDLRIPYPSISLLETAVDLLLKKIEAGEIEDKHIPEGKENSAFISALRLVSLSDVGITSSASIIVEIS